MQEKVLRNQGDKGGTGGDASADEKENTGTTASPWLPLLSPHLLCADVPAGLRKRHGDRGACFSVREREKAVHVSLLGTCLSSCCSLQPLPLHCRLPRPHQEHQHFYGTQRYNLGFFMAEAKRYFQNFGSSLLTSPAQCPPYADFR